MENLIIFGTTNSDNISPSMNNNTIFAGAGNDVVDLSSRNGNNRVFGGGGNNKLIANFNDYLFGGDGDDQLFTGNGDNIISGGAGNDQFWLVKNAIIPENGTTILDFTPDVDRIIIDNVTGVSQLNDLTLIDQEGSTLIQIGDKDVTLLGINKNQLQETDFIFSAIKITANLANDTGISNQDGITSDPTITGNIETDNIKALKATLNNSNLDILPLVNQDGSFTLTKEKLTEINGGNLPDGKYNLQLIATDNNDNNSELITVSFTLDTIAPTLNITSPSFKLSTLTPDLSKDNSPVDPTIVNLASKEWGLGNITGNVNDVNLSIINYQLNNGNPITINVNTNGEFSQPLALEVLENTYPNLTVTGTDLAGNTTNNNSLLGLISQKLTGLGYLDIQVGTGDSPDPNLTDKDNVTVHYTGTLTNGEVFDSSRSRGTPSTFSINQVIQGFKEGLDSMNVGGRRILFIPPNLGYGSGGTTNIPPNATLIFDVELFSIS